jgi:hypothetical protein
MGKIVALKLVIDFLQRAYKHMKINSVLLPGHIAAMAVKHYTNTVVEILCAVQTSFTVFLMLNQMTTNFKQSFMRT